MGNNRGLKGTSLYSFGAFLFIANIPPYRCKKVSLKPLGWSRVTPLVGPCAPIKLVTKAVCYSPVLLLRASHRTPDPESGN